MKCTYNQLSELATHSTLFSIYWVGDKIEDKYLCCSFGASPETLAELKLVETRQHDGRRMHLYELLGRYGMVRKTPYKAMCAYIDETDSSQCDDPTGPREQRN